MTNVEARVRSVYQNLNPSEKKIADYLLNNIENIFQIPIAQLAATTGTSQVSWVRFCKTIGFNGLKDLKNSLFSELNESLAEAPQKPCAFSDVKDFSTLEEMRDSIRDNASMAIEHTFKLLDLQEVERAAVLLNGAASIKLFGVGASSLVAEDLANKLIRIGSNTCFSKDLHIQLTYAANLRAQDAAVFVSYSGNTQEIIELLSLAERAGSKTIAITHFDKSELSSRADVVLSTSAPEIDMRSGATSSRIAQMAVVDLLFTVLANRNYENIHKNLESSYDICSRHRRT